MADFLKQLKRRQEAAEKPVLGEVEARPTEQMTDEELEEAITANRRKLLDAQHQELREREILRVTGRVGDHHARDRTLSDVLREKQRGKRRTWR